MDLCMLVQTLNLLLPKYTKLHCMFIIIAQIFPMGIGSGGGEILWTEIIFKGGDYVRVVNHAKFFASIFHLWCHNSVTNFSLYLLSHSYHALFNLVKMFLYIYVTEVFLVYFEKLVCSNSDVD